jgi:peptide/nickel transport system substrate-binding protein
MPIGTGPSKMVEFKPGKDGRRMKSVYQTAVNPMRQKTQAIVKKAFEQIGIDVELKALNAGGYFSSDPANPDTYAHF